MSNDEMGLRRTFKDAVAGDDPPSAAGSRPQTTTEIHRRPRTAATVEDLDETMQQIRAYFRHADLWSTP